MARQMKDSGIEWISDIPADWGTTKCKYISDFINGYAFDSKDLTNDFIYPAIRIGDISNGSVDFTNCQGVKNNEGLEKYKINTNDILLAMSGATVGKVGLVTNPPCAYINQRVGIIRSLYYKYLFYCLSTDEFIEHILLEASGSAQPNVSGSVFGEFQIPFPTAEKIKAIIACLDRKCHEIDAVIEKTKATIEEYKALKQSIITEAVTKGIRGDRPMKDSGIEWIGEIPAEWSVSKIKIGVFKVGSGKTPLGGAESYAEEGVLFLRSQNVYDTGLFLDSPTYITEAVDEEMKNTRVYPRDVLLNITGGSIGRCCIFPNECIRANVNQHVSIIRVIESIFLPEYMHYYWLSSLGRTAIDLYQTGGNREGMSADAIKNSPIPVIPINEQKEIVEYLDKKCAEIDTLIAKKTALLEEMENYKKSVIYEYVTGKKEVK